VRTSTHVVDPAAAGGAATDLWRSWLLDAGRTPLRLPVPPSDGGRVLVLAAHPDDVLVAGGVLADLSEAGWTVDCVWATDGEGAHPRPGSSGPGDRGRTRRHDAARSLTDLGLRGSATWLGLPDTGLSACTDALQRALGEEVTGAAVVVAPWRQDGDPDHEVAGWAAARAAHTVGATLWELPVSALTWGTPPDLEPAWPHARVHRVVRDRSGVALPSRRVVELVLETPGVGPRRL
jgi:LmbE family N-acetylglucosaminyl deacetylase